MVRFRAQGGDYAVPVQDVRQVRVTDHLSLIPSGRAGVAAVRGGIRWTLARIDGKTRSGEAVRRRCEIGDRGLAAFMLRLETRQLR